MTMLITLPWRPVRIDGGPEILTSLTDREAAALQRLAAGKIALEAGSAYGYSAIVMAQTAAHVLAVDPHAGYGSLPNSLQAMRRNLAAYGVQDRVSIVVAASGVALEMLAGAGATVSLVFIDGDHRYPAVERDIRLGWELLPVGGVLAVHDHGEVSCPDVRRALDAWHPWPDEQVDTLWLRHK